MEEENTSETSGEENDSDTDKENEENIEKERQEIKNRYIEEKWNDKENKWEKRTREEILAIPQIHYRKQTFIKEEKESQIKRKIQEIENEIE